MMNGLIQRGLVTACLVGGVVVSNGCVYRKLVDPCWPERYEYLARQEVNEAFCAQVNNGHVLDQTVWNYHFEAGTDKLTPGALQHLAYLARRRPTPDPVLYLQTAQDVPYDPAAPERYAEQRTGLDGRRIESVKKFLGAQTAGRGVDFQVMVHDPSEVGMAAQPAALSIQKMYQGVRGTLPLATGSISGGSGSSQ